MCTYCACFGNDLIFGRIEPIVAIWWQTMSWFRYLENKLLNLSSNWFIHLIGMASKLIWFWATLVRLWPSGGRKRAEWFPTVIWINNHSTRFKLDAYTYGQICSCRNDSRCSNFSPLVAKKMAENGEWNWWFSDYYLEINYSIHFKLALYMYFLADFS